MIMVAMLLGVGIGCAFACWMAREPDLRRVELWRWREHGRTYARLGSGRVVEVR